QPCDTRSTAWCRSALECAIRSASGSGYPASMRTCSLQLSTFACSSLGVSVICDIGVRVVRPVLDEPSFGKFVKIPLPVSAGPKRRGQAGLGRVEQVVDAPLELVQARVEHGSLRFRVGRERLDLGSDLDLGVGEALLQPRRDPVLLVLEGGAQRGDLLLVAL